MSKAHDFVHLHLHTEYSLLDGFARINRAVDYAKELNMSALAITDHGTMFGVIDFFNACRDAEIKPIIGVEAYLARRTRHDRDPQLDTSPFHMLLLAKNQTGYKNLLKLSSVAQLDGYYYRPRIDRELLEQHSDGLVATSGCLAAEIPRMLEQGREEEAKQRIGWYQDVFGKENFFLELQAHDIPELDRVNKWLLENAGYAETPLVATNDVHYVRKEDFETHDTLLCIQTSSFKNDVKRLRMTDNSYHMRTQQDMWNLFGQAAPQALSNTLLIAEMCDLDLSSKDYHLPVFPVPPQYGDAEAYLRHLCLRGLEWRYGNHASDSEVVERLNFELSVINRMGFETYFLIVWDLCEFARHADIWWNVRGSGAGSLVAYSLGITSLDPLANGLLFERFLNPGRISMPDFDLDYPEDRRAEMIEYCTNKYGRDKVAAIITFGTLGAKAAVRDVGRALEVPLPEVDRIARTIPSAPKIPKIPELIGDDPEKAVPDLKALYSSDPTARKIIDIAAAVEGVPRHASTHAAGVIVSDRPLDEYVPLHRPTRGDGEDNPVKMVTQFPMETAESIGLLKIDFLGLSTLTILRKACDLIAQYHGINYDMESIPIRPDPDDDEVTRRVEKTFEMIGRGETLGVFQIESSGMRQMLTQMRPKTFEHIIAAISLYRPGPMEFIPNFNRRMHGEEAVEYHHPKLEPILSNTYGIMVYQEQLMRIGADLFGYSLGEADLMRKAVSKKKKADLLEHRNLFVERGPENGVDPDTANKIFDDIEYFARYGFNRSHAADYALLTCKTAYLKCHYPHEYMTALMSVYFDVSARVGLFVADCSRMGIDVLPPDVNRSYREFSIEGNEKGGRSIRFGLGAVKNLGAGAIDYLLSCRGDTPFTDLDDFLKRCDMREFGKRGLESLIRAGALDGYGERAFLLANLERMAGFSTEHHKNAEVGQVSMFDLLGGTDAGSVISAMTEKPPESWDRREQLRWEKDLLGLYISAHPLTAVWTTLQQIITHTTSELAEDGPMLKGKPVTIAGLVTEVRAITTRKGDAMAVLTLEDIQGTVECVLFPRTWGEYRDLVDEDKVMVVRGKADMRSTDVNVLVDSVSQDFQVAEAADRPLITYSDAGLDDELIDEETGEVIHEKAVPSPAPPLSVAPATAGASQESPRLEPQFGAAPAQEAVLEEPEEIRHAFSNVRDAVEKQSIQTSDPATQEEVKPVPVPRPSTLSVPERKLVIEMERTGDARQDRRRLSHLHGSVSQYPGEDAFCIVIRQPDGKRFRMDFSAVRVKIHPKLIKELGERQGVRDVYIE